MGGRAVIYSGSQRRVGGYSMCFDSGTRRAPPRLGAVLALALWALWLPTPAGGSATSAPSKVRPLIGTDEELADYLSQGRRLV
jgi:hypothetical protein